MTKPITLSSGKYLLVSVPEGASYFIDNVTSYLRFRHYINSVEVPSSVDIQLPPGSYTLIGKADELSEDEWKGIVERYIYSGRSSYYAYKDYLERKPQSEEDIITNPLESGHSLLESHGMKQGTTVILKIN